MHRFVFSNQYYTSSTPSLSLQASCKVTRRSQWLQVDGVWHTSVVVDGVEYFYGGGVQQAMAGTTPYGEPVDIIYLGYIIYPLCCQKSATEILVQLMSSGKSCSLPWTPAGRHRC